jgi:acyl carrier protein
VAFPLHHRQSAASTRGTITQDEAMDIMRDALRQVAPEADLGDVAPEDDMAATLDLDSMDFLNFMIGLHERTGIEIPELDYPQLATVEKCAAYLIAHS